MSGGVDSTVAALLLKNAGYHTAGITLRLHLKKEADATENSCCSSRDIEDAIAVSNKIGIEHTVLDFSDDFEKFVVRPFAESYLCGDTPNPCIECNRHIKFKALNSECRKRGFTNFATGHYARIKYDEGSGRHLLMTGLDKTKDQSYVLFSLTQDILSMALFPVGELTKGEVREIADSVGLINSQKPDSQDICFIPDGDYRTFIKKTYGAESNPGDFVDINGNVLGSHKGLIGYTTGQRKGLGVSAEHPLYVVRKDIDKNAIVLGSKSDLYSKNLVCRDTNFIPFDSLTSSMKVEAKIRYSQRTAAAKISPIDDGRVYVEFEEPQRAVTAGQSVVFYDGDVVVGGGKIC